MNELIINIAELIAEPYSEKTIEISSNLGTVELRGQDVNVGNVFISGSASNATTGILLKAKVNATVIFSCTRCLEKFSHPLNLELNEFYSFSKEEDEHFVENDSIDIGSAIIEALALSLDMKILCKADCAGLCPKCGTDLNKEQCKCKDQEVDLRWHKLEELKKKLESQKPKPKDEN